MSGSHGRLVVRMVLGVAAMVTGLLSYAAPAHALPAPQASSCAGVWVVVDFGTLGGTATACAGSYSTGMAALRSIPAFAPTLDAGMVVKINGLPAVPNTQVDYWSYWHATRQSDGTYSGWTYANSGPSSFLPTPGDAEGWRYEAVNGANVAPRVAPPTQTATTQAPPPPAPATTSRATTTATRAATTMAVPAGTQVAPATSSAPVTPPASVSSASVGTPSDTAGATGSASPSAPASAQPASTSTSSLFGGVGAIAAIALGAAGMLFWRTKLSAKG